MRKWPFTDVVFRHFGLKNGKCLKAARMFSFEITRNRKTPDGVKLNALPNSYLGLLTFFDFDHKIQNFDFQKCVYPKSKIFNLSQKLLHVIKINTKNSIQNFKPISIFGCALAKKNWYGDVTSLKQNFGICNSRT